jgi:hypothetical protein
MRHRKASVHVVTQYTLAGMHKVPDVVAFILVAEVYGDFYNTCKCKRRKRLLLFTSVDTSWQPDREHAGPACRIDGRELSPLQH